jgi:acetylornithine deacetylase/succinyl-diaminopimelate desuccinylase-like protein
VRDESDKSAQEEAGGDPDGDVVALCAELIRLDTSNTGGPDGPGERAAAEYVAERLAEAGVATQIFESEPGRASLVGRIEGSDPSRPALLVHCHLDVVPADPASWTVHPFSGEVKDGYLWGRGAVDMKDMCAMVLAVVRRWHRVGYRPPRDIVLAFLADEETGSKLGAHWIVREHPELFDGCTEAVGEVGGFSYTVHDQLRLYPIMTAEKGKTWIRLTTRGTARHGSMLGRDNAIVDLAEAVARLGRHQFPMRLTDAVRGFLDAAQQATGADLSPQGVDQNLDKLGPLSGMIGATLRNTMHPSMLRAGANVNVVPEEAVAYADGRFLPGYEAEFHQQISEVLGPDVEWDLVLRDIALETTFDGPLVGAMAAALVAEDAGARAVPYMLSGGTDAKAFALLGMRCFGFSPLRLPADLDFGSLFHGVDERVPVDALTFGDRVLDRFLRTC